MIMACNIRNYSIYNKDGYLFSYFEYVGEHFDRDMGTIICLINQYSKGYFADWFFVIYDVIYEIIIVFLEILSI
jgi:L-rhamnose mutarotase